MWAACRGRMAPIGPAAKTTLSCAGWLRRGCASARDRPRCDQRGRIHQGWRLALICGRSFRWFRGAAAGRRQTDHPAGQGPRGVRRFLPLRGAARHPVLRTGRAGQALASALGRTGPIRYRGEDSLKREIDVFRGAVGPDTEAFITTTAPASLEPYRGNEYYRTRKTSSSPSPRPCGPSTRRSSTAGFILQVDDAWLTALWDRIGIPMGLEAFRRYCEMRIEALNHALRGLPEDRIRYHLCWEAGTARTPTTSSSRRSST